MILYLRIYGNKKYYKKLCIKLLSLIVRRPENT